MAKRSERRRRQLGATASPTAAMRNGRGARGIALQVPLRPWNAARARLATVGLPAKGRGWWLAALLLLGLEVALVLVGLNLSRFGAREALRGNWEDLVYSGPLADLVSFWQRWDALWYQHIAQTGYAAGDGTTAFFPLYPLLSRIVSFVFLGNVVLGELVVSAIAFACAMGLLWRLVSLEASRRLPRSWSLPFEVTPGRVTVLSALTVLLLAFFPFGFFLLAPYTESLFLLLAIASLLLTRSGHPWAAGAVGLLAGLTRTQGVFLALPIAYEHLRERDVWSWIRRRGGRRPGVALLASVLPAGGLVLFTLYQWYVLGEHRTGIDALALWGYQLALPWDALAASWAYISNTTGNMNAQTVELFNFACLAGSAAIAIVGARRLPGAYTTYALPSIGLLFFREMAFSPLMSVARYTLVVFPCFMVVASWLVPHPKVAAGLLVLSAVLDLVFFQYWARWGFVG